MKPGSAGTKHNLATMATSGAAVAGCGVFASGWVSNDGTTILCLQLFDQATAPTLGATPSQVPVICPGAQTTSLDQAEGWRFDTGLAWGLSTTFATFTPYVGTDAGVQLNFY